MKNLLIISFLLISGNLFGQISQDSLFGKKLLNRKTYSEKDTIPSLVYLQNVWNKNNGVLWYLNGAIIEEQIIYTINPKLIKEMKIEKEEIEINETMYTGAVYISMKDNYQAKLISLNELKTKYLDLANGKPVLFFLDKKVINHDYDKFRVDENYILKIEVQEVENKKEQLDIIIVELTTRTEENLKKANTIYIKGNSIIN